MDETERLNDLIARCEKASGADRRLDAAIYKIARPEFSDMNADNPHSAAGWLVGGDHLQPECAPEYTASLDAAMTLVRPDCEWEIGSAKLIGVYWARLISAAEYTAKRAPTPALALVIAALKARLTAPSSGTDNKE